MPKIIFRHHQPSGPTGSVLRRKMILTGGGSPPVVFLNVEILSSNIPQLGDDFARGIVSSSDKAFCFSVWVSSEYFPHAGFAVDDAVVRDAIGGDVEVILVES